jgi:hypothetical protein
MYLTGEIRAKFIQIIVEERVAKNLGSLIDGISEDSQDRK